MAVVLVSGGSGKVGRDVVRGLLARGEWVRLASRTASSVVDGGRLQRVCFDYTRPETFPAALSDVDRVFLICPPGDATPHLTVRNFVSALRGLRNLHIVNLSAFGVERRPDTGLRKVELELEAISCSLTHLRANWFMQNFLCGRLWAEVCQRCELRLPAGVASISFVHTRDVADIAVASLCSPQLGVRAYEVTGGESLDHFAVAREIGEFLHHRVTYVPIPEEIARNEGLDEVSLEYYKFVRQGLFSRVSDGVRLVLGRAPLPFAQAFEDKRGGAL